MTPKPYEGMQSLPPLPKRLRPSKASSREPQQEARTLGSPIVSLSYIRPSWENP
jgi:hypothetical protein